MRKTLPSRPGRSARRHRSLVSPTFSPLEMHNRLPITLTLGAAGSGPVTIPRDVGDVDTRRAVRLRTDEPALRRFQETLRLNPTVVREIERWAGDPRLAPLHRVLVAHATEYNERAFLDAYAEAMVARHLLRQGCTFELDVITPNGRSADFEVFADGYRFFLHIKRLRSARNAGPHRPIPARLRVLENVPRSFTASVRWRDGAVPEDLQRFVERGERFLRKGHVGEELTIRDDTNREVGGLRILGSWDGPHVRLVRGESAGFVDDVPRIQKLLRKASRQLMPGAINVVLVCGRHEHGEFEFEQALLGTEVERWDRHPPAGRRIAHGRAADGFWNGRAYADWQAGGWFRFDPMQDRLRSRLWIRAHLGVPTQVMSNLVELFHR